MSIAQRFMVLDILSNLLVIVIYLKSFSQISIPFVPYKIDSKELISDKSAIAGELNGAAPFCKS